MEAGGIFGDSPLVHLDFRGLGRSFQHVGRLAQTRSSGVSPEIPPGQAAVALGRPGGDQGPAGRGGTREV